VISALLTAGLNVEVAQAQLVASVLPSARTILLEQNTRGYATVFATVINGGSTPLTGCQAVLPGDPGVRLDYQTTNPTSNALIGAANTPFELAPGAAQSLVLSFSSIRTFRGPVGPIVACNGGATSPSVEGLTTVNLAFVDQAAPDIIPIALTTSGDGVIRVPESDGRNVMVLAAVNIGAASRVVVRPVGRLRTSSGFSASLLICETNASGVCLEPPLPFIEAEFLPNTPRTFTVFVEGVSGPEVAFDPASNRVSVEFLYDWDGKLTGRTGAAVIVPPSQFGQDVISARSRLLSQATFGLNFEDVKAAARMTPAQWVEQQLNTPIADTHWSYVTRGGPPGCNPCDAQYINAIMESFWLGASRGEDQLRKRVAFALSQIMVISEVGNTLDTQTLAFASYLDTLEAHSFGNFRDLLGEVARHPAMAHYLSHMRNERADPVTGRLPDENFAREILQLFSIGLWELNLDGSRRLDAQNQPIPTYDQTDILNMARVFTGMSWGGPDTSENRWNGWPIDGQETVAWNWPLQFYPQFHAPEPKAILKRRTIPANTPGPESFDIALDVIFNHPNVGPFISEQLIQRLVTSNPSRAYVQRVATRFNDNGSGVRGDMKAVIRAILLDDEARIPPTGPDAFRYGKLREPMLRFSQWIRGFDAKASNQRYQIWNLENPVDGLGQNPFRAPSVFNWFRPDYVPPGAMAAANLRAPEFNLIHETTVTGYSNFIRSVVNWGFGWGEGQIAPDYSVELGLAHTPAALADYLATKLGIGGLSASTREKIIEAVDSIGYFDWSGPERRTVTAIYMMMTSPDFLVQR
jgi:uncharacterized protein (DUF1800 family)